MISRKRNVVNNDASKWSVFESAEKKTEGCYNQRGTAEELGA